MNDLYTREWCWYNNFFRPSFKLKEKIRIGGKYKRKYDPPVTPNQRVLESPSVSEEKKAKLKMIQKLSKITFDEWQPTHQTPSLQLPF